MSDLSQTTMSDVDSQRIVALLHVVNDLEHIGDSIVKIARNVQKKLEGGLRFSDLGREEMLAYHVQVRDVINAAFESFRKRDAALAQQVLSRGGRSNARRTGAAGKPHRPLAVGSQ